MNDAAIVVTSIADDGHPILQQIARQAKSRDIPFIVIGDVRSPADFAIDGCDYYGIDRQRGMPFSLADILPTGHYGRKNLGYLIAIRNGAKILVETYPHPLHSRTRVPHAIS